jgi:hypothetical protein
LRIGGVILIDDALHKGVQKFIKYIDTNYKNYEKIETLKLNVLILKYHMMTEIGFIIKTSKSANPGFPYHPILLGFIFY